MKIKELLQNLSDFKNGKVEPKKKYDLLMKNYQKEVFNNAEIKQRIIEITKQRDTAWENIKSLEKEIKEYRKNLIT